MHHLITLNRTEKAVRMLCVSLSVMCGCGQIVAQSSMSDSSDQFRLHRVSDIFEGKPAPPVLSTPEAHLFRSRIREGVAQGVVFAGHYEVAKWGCGSGCLSFAVIDAFTGKVTMFPATVSHDREVGKLLTYRRNSGAIHIVGSLNEKDSADRWYVWNGDEFILISRHAAVLVEDNGDLMKH